MKLLLTLSIMAGILACGNTNPSSVGKVKPAEDLGGTINTICVEGHVYYIWRPTNGIAPKLQDNGKPVKCD